MADSNLTRGEPRHFHENDPFAELTRIMAREGASSEAATADSFDIDLEKELLGDLEAPFAEQGELSEAEPAVEEAAAPTDRADDYPAVDDYPETAVERDYAETRAEPEMPVEATGAADDDAVAPEAFDDAFASDFGSAEWQENSFEPDGADEVARAEMSAQEAPSRSWEPEPLSEAADTVVPQSVHAEAVDDDLGLADVDMDFGELDISDEADAAQFDEAVDPEPAGDEPMNAAPEPEDIAFAWEPTARDELSLEDELGMLLSDGGAQHVDAARVDERAVAQEWRYEESAAESEAAPHMPLYGRANYQPADDDYQPAEEGWKPDREIVEPESLEVEDRWAGEPDWVGPDAEAAIEGAPEEHVAEHAASVEATAEENGAPEPEPQPDPFSVFAAMAPLSQQPQPPAVSPNSAGPYDAAEEFDTIEVPEAATPLRDDLDLPEMEAADEPPPAYDDYDVEFAQVFGDLGDEVAPATAAERPAERETDDRFLAETLGFGPAATSATGASEDYPASSWYEGGQDYAPDEDEALYRAGELEREIDVASYGAAAAPSRRSRTGIYAAAAVVAVAVLGGVGAFALSSSGGAGDEPVLVQADAEPLKVKPENPGGATVPNQDSQVYERVAGNTTERPAAQERLVSTTEEPVDLVARAQPERAEEEVFALPGVDEGISAVREAETEIAAKSEERIETQQQEAAGVGATEDLAAVQPRRVRTMVVRPDGTLVPRDDDPAPSEPALSDAGQLANAGPLAPQESLLPPVLQPSAAAVAEPAAQTIREVSTQAQTAASPAAGEAPAQPANQQQPQTVVAAASTDVVTPSTGPIVQQRPAGQPAASQPVQQQAQQQAAQAAVPARTPPAAPQPQATAGEWSMQIASQPTAESAQATYQDLARRYGNIIGAHGVNIVRADIPGKGTYYRVRIPSSTRAEAISLCEKYKAAGGSCFVSK